ncbi:MAG: D-TA family PLP-dependent enzyme [Verrucomicrobiales bacterium]|nr:D-TA family PLP-dependent enzyme [Verrucomicrobiales bacterium]
MPFISGLEKVTSPALLFDADAIERNLERMLEIVAGNASILRPHIKTHKCAEILALQLARGIRSTKCATLAEAELSARAGIPDVLISYPLIGPNIALFSELITAYPETTFSTVTDSVNGIEALAEVPFQFPLKVLLDLDVGMHRTGVLPGDAAFELVELIRSKPNLCFNGLHAYDGHIHTADPNARRADFDAAINRLDQFLGRLDLEGIDVPLVVSGGTPTFAFHAERALSSPPGTWQCSPGTPLLWDAGYGEHYPDLPFEPAAFLLARVISHPGENLACLDLGHKAVAAENPLGNRIRFPDSGFLNVLSQSEEHLVVETSAESRPAIGEAVLGIPYHVCPSVALYDEAHLIRNGNASGERWRITARKRSLTP